MTEQKPEELLEGDVEAILLFLRNTSFGPEYNIFVNDPKTGKSFEATVMLDELNIIQSKTQPNNEGFFEIVLPMSGAHVKLKMLSLMDTMEIDRIVDLYPIGYNAPIVTTRLSKTIVELNGDRDPNKIATFIQNMPINDSKFIRNFMRDNEPRLDLKRTVIAPSGEKVDVNIAFGVEFFRPFF